MQAEILQHFQEEKFINQDYRQKECKIPKRRGCFFTQHIFRDMNQLRMSQGSTGKSSASPGETKTIVWNRCSYQVPAMIGTNTSTNENQNFYDSKVQAISTGGGDCATKVGSICARFVGMGTSAKIQVENGINKLFNFRGQTIDVSYQAIFI